MLHDFARSAQTPYIVFQQNRDHNDAQILAIQKHIEEKYLSSTPGSVPLNIKQNFIEIECNFYHPTL
jgi:hypothetical protein